ncbi:MAG: NADH-quinone oxidoreductase subunit NuoG [Sedimentisphaerales bacterium]
MPIIYINDKPYEVEPEQNLLHACLTLGFDIPYFCWHPALHSVGACRMCAVKQFKDENDKKGRIVMSCMTLVSDGLRISIDDPEVVKFRKSVIEWLMLNHPHDCPVCDEGGECHLQDMTVLAGHTYRRTRFKKRTYVNQDLGPFIRHEMNRCIQCYRCVRFYLDYAGGRDLDVFGWHNRVYFGKNKDGLLRNEFSGNLIEICPTGVFTDKTFFKHYTRKWDLQSAPSVCTHCGLGCNIHADSRYGQLRRIRNRYHSDVNSYFLCDRGRFGYDFVNSSKRISKNLLRAVDDSFNAVAKEAILNEVEAEIKNKNIIGIGSSRASLESNYALKKLVGEDNFYIGTSSVESDMVSKVIDTLSNRAIKSATMNEVSNADAIVILGEDVLNFAPMLGLAVRRSILQKPSAIIKELHIEPWNDAAVREALQQKKGPLYIAVTNGTGLDKDATEVCCCAPADIARLGFAVAHKLDLESPAVEHLSEETDSLAQRIVDDLNDSKRPCIIAGTSLADKTIIEAAANIAQALYSKNSNARICFTVPSCNSIGLELLGGKPLEDAVEKSHRGEIETIIIIENDIYRHIDADKAGKLLHGADTVIAIDSIETSTTRKADIVLPAATFAESSGTFINNEARAQRFYKSFIPLPDIQDSWKWIRQILIDCNILNEDQWESLDSILEEIAERYESLKLITQAAKPADFRALEQKIPRQSHRYSGRTAIHAHKDVNEQPPPKDKDSALTYSMEGYSGQPPASLISHYWAPYWNSVQSVNKYQEYVGGPIRDDHAGIRLIEPSKHLKKEYFDEIPDAFKPLENSIYIVPSYHIFGSEELSSLSEPVTELIEPPYIAVNPDTIKSIETDGDGAVEVVFSETSYHLAVKVNPTIPKGLALVPMGFNGLQWDGLPFWRKEPKS